MAIPASLLSRDERDSDAGEPLFCGYDQFGLQIKERRTRMARATILTTERGEKGEDNFVLAR